MIIYPAIDIKDGKCVRLMKGLKELSTEYSKNPVEVALQWQKEGADYIHLVDLDGAFNGKLHNTEIIREIVKKVDVPIQLGGGIRSLSSIRVLLDIGISRVILGTKAVVDLNFLRKAVNDFPDKIIVSLDAKEGYLAINGWESTSPIKAMDFVEILEGLGIKEIIYTDISKDGMLEGPNFIEIRNMLNKTSLKLIASGGITTVNDLVQLKELGVEGAIVGKALYEGRLTLKEGREALGC